MADLVRTGRARSLRGIGPGIEARLRELVETGEIAELAELERDLSPELVGPGPLPRARDQALARARPGAGRAHRRGVSRGGHRRPAARSARGSDPRPKRACSRPWPASRIRAPRQGLLLNRALELSGAVAAALGGEIAGDARRWRDSCERLAVVCAGGRPRAGARSVRDAAPDRRGDRTLRAASGRRDRRRGADRARRRRGRSGSAPSSFGAPARRDYVAALEPLPDAPDEGARVQRARTAVVPSRAERAAVPRRTASARRARGHPGRPALSHDLVGRPGERRGDGARGTRSRIRLRRDLRSHPGRGGGAWPHARRRSAPGRGDRRGQRAARPVPRAARHRVRHPRRWQARPPRRRARGARLGAGERSRAASGCRAAR